MNLLDVLRIYRQDIWSERVALVRHADARWDLDVLRRSGHFDEYQARQSRPVFGCKYIVAFLGEKGPRSRFVGVYAVLGVSGEIPPWPAGFPYPQMAPGKYRYDLAKLGDFAEVEDRLVIDWGPGTRAWVQRLRVDKSKHVIELLCSPALTAMQGPLFVVVHGAGFKVPRRLSAKSFTRVLEGRASAAGIAQGKVSVHGLRAGAFVRKGTRG